LSFVIDASVALAWSFHDEANVQVLPVLEKTKLDPAMAPMLWAYEVANGLLGALRRGRLKRDEVPKLLGLFAQLNIQLDHVPEALVWGEILTLAIEHRLTVYDAAYLELAIRRHVPLATLDRELARAATKSGIVLLIDP